jgi:hypothetical protein
MKHSLKAVERRIRLILDEVFLGPQNVSLKTQFSNFYVVLPEDTSPRLKECFEHALEAAVPSYKLEIIRFDRNIYVVKEVRHAGDGHNG